MGMLKSLLIVMLTDGSQADLKAMYIVPRTPSPPPVEEETIIKTLNDRDIELLSEQELREIVRNVS